jgi:hypothetical protein
MEWNHRSRPVMGDTLKDALSHNTESLLRLAGENGLSEHMNREVKAAQKDGTWA